jgi:hypothetical protein
MRIESMAGYPGNKKVALAGVSLEINQFQNQISAFQE